MSLRVQTVSNVVGGQWQIFVYPDAAAVANMTAEDYDVTQFRDAPTEMATFGTTDPFGPSVATLTFPKVTIFDRKGQGDLWWCVPEANVDISWVTESGVRYTWEGFIASFEYGEASTGTQMSVQCVGALRQTDYYLAKPEYLYAPLPFERAIARQFENRPDLRVGRMTMLWPTWWTKTREADYSLIGRDWLVPAEVAVGQLWTGMVTRYTGQFEPALTGYIQQLLSSMHTERGQFTLMLESGRRPVLRHRDTLLAPGPDTLVTDLLWPGVSMSVSEDHTQKLNTVFVYGRTLAGTTYSGMQVSNDGTKTVYVPYAARRNVFPTEDNAWLDTTQMRREVQLQAAEGMSADDARSLARAHLQRFSDPGLTGTLTLNVDPMLDGHLFPRQIVTAGMSIQVRSLFGQPDGRVFHISETTCTGEGNLTLTLDSKFRDQLTVQEVRLRGRDALTPTRMLTTGAYQPNVPDMLFPWSYDLGAGYIPWGAKDLFRGAPPANANDQFPWTDWTTAYPPRNHPDKYVRVGPASTNADENWSVGVPVLLSAAGTSRLVQIAAYDRDGNVSPVGFHVSLYYSNSTAYTVGPMLPDEFEVLTGYTAGQHYPFYPGAWETVDASGQTLPIAWQAEASASIIVGWGNYYERAGYWPGQSSDPADAPTGLFTDEASFSWDTTTLQGGVNPQEPTDVNTTAVERAMVSVIVYCDDQGTDEVFFMGRIFRAEPGTA